MAPSYNDKILEVVAVFSTVQLGMAIVVPDGVLQHHRIAQCKSVKITILGEWHAPIVTFCLFLEYRDNCDKENSAGCAPVSRPHLCRRSLISGSIHGWSLPHLTCELLT